MKTFPIRLDDEIKTIPWDMMVDARARVEAMGQPVKSVDELAVTGLTPEDAIAFLTNQPWQRMTVSGARLRLRELVANWTAKSGPSDTTQAPSLIPEPRDLAEKTLADLEKAAGLLRAIQRQQPPKSLVSRECTDLLEIISNTHIAVIALQHRKVKT